MDSKEVTKIDDFIEVFQDFKQKQQNQKLRGLNNFNLFTTLLKQSDEVKLHSRFLHFLLKPHGEHCQDELFLDLFLKACNLTGFLDTKNTSVFAEYNYMDLYLKDENRHICIENKIWAGDQPKQIERYIEDIKEENEKNEESKENEEKDLTVNLAVIYLSLDRLEPSSDSLGDFRVVTEDDDSFLVRGSEKYIFRSIHYKEQIKKWLVESYKQVSNITNLSIAIAQYQEVIAMLYNDYRDKIMSLKEYLGNKKENRLELLQTMRKISNEYPNFRRNEMESFWRQVEEQLKRKFENSEWEVSRLGKKLWEGHSWNCPLRIQQSEDAKVRFGFEYTKHGFRDSIWGIIRKDDGTDFKELKKNEEIANKLEQLKKDLDTAGHHSIWWLWFDYYHHDDLSEKIIDEKDSDQASKKFVDEFIEIFEKCKDMIILCNKILDNQKES